MTEISPSIFKTKRLLMIPATAATVRAEIDDHGELAKLLNAEVPDNWPPELTGDVLEQFYEMLRDDPELSGWMLNYLVLRDDPPTAVGVAGYKGRPREDGCLEIGYSVLKQFQKKGYATEAVEALVERSFSLPEVKSVIGETLPGLTASIRVMEKAGFRFTGEGSEEGVIRYALERKEFRTD